MLDSCVCGGERGWVVSEDLEGQARENRDNGGRGRLAQARFLSGAE
jgi:hypothetical protein